MLDIQNYTSFVTAILVFQAVPGAGTIAILDATARQGRAAGMAAVLGTLLGDLVFMVGAALGLAALMQARPVVFQALQWFGVAYLVWLGVQLLRSPASGGPAQPAPAQPAAAYFRKAVLVSLTNPKVLLFFVAFFPLFLKPGASAATLPVMMLHVTVLSLAYQAALVLVGNLIAVRLAGFAGARRAATRLAGLALIGLGAKLASGVR
ncbi:LysE family translocator [Pseudorhodoferax sp. Leaf265]|uniref:LysE family translocator n=1 Tax=Pseudorhodoferax sp. Leaf265 TaxID=1736315 RepID=UPI0006FDB96A|nr:LysE family transporter [Pseudorhodoferax sp. Leaf265]KQP03149.1 threonine transporter [Pseudorhodoferax sp. Leaf265]PZP95430.1 MAG: LysE family translocator [Variovorax paradoxus]PZQ06201.1 MAG: LysE family translocator [Variovorax paradoxus]